jgi:phospholipase/carboxylesterase
MSELDVFNRPSRAIKRHDLPTSAAARDTHHLDLHLAGGALRLGPPPPDARAVVVAVHGRSLSPEYMVEHLVDRLRFDRRDDVSFILPRADHDSWYPAGFLSPMHENQPALDDALAVMRRVESELDGIDRRHVVWAGFSQGACMVAEHVARHPARWGGLAVLTGGLISALGEPVGTGTFDGMPAYFSNGDDDSWVPAWHTEATAEQFRRAGASVLVDVIPARPHEISDGEVERVAGLIVGAMA